MERFAGTAYNIRTALRRRAGCIVSYFPLPNPLHDGPEVERTTFILTRNRSQHWQRLGRCSSTIGGKEKGKEARLITKAFLYLTLTSSLEHFSPTIFQVDNHTPTLAHEIAPIQELDRQNTQTCLGPDVPSFQSSLSNGIAPTPVIFRNIRKLRRPLSSDSCSLSATSSSSSSWM